MKVASIQPTRSLFSLDSAKKGDGIKITNGLTAEKTNNDYESVFATEPCISGQHNWDVMIDRYVSDEDVFIGVASGSASLFNNPRYETNWYYYLASSGTVGGPEGQDIPFCESARTGDVIGKLIRDNSCLNPFVLRCSP